MNRSPSELEAEIAASRETLARDLDALKDKAAPRRLAGEAARTAAARTRAAGRTLLSRAKSNPLPVALIGGAVAGAAWLFGWRGRSRKDRVAASCR